MSRALDISGKLSTSLNGHAVSITGQGSVVEIDFASPSAFRDALGTPAIRDKTFLRQLHEGLSQAELTLVLSVASREVAKVGHEARAGIVSKALGYGPLQLKIWRLLRTLTK